MHGKIHRATVTEANLEYMGSITIDADLLDAAGILPGERVQICNNNNGARLETYTIAGKRGSGVICLNGAAAISSSSSLMPAWMKKKPEALSRKSSWSMAKIISFAKEARKRKEKPSDSFFCFPRKGVIPCLKNSFISAPGTWLPASSLQAYAASYGLPS
mgnify:FL=1